MARRILRTTDFIDSLRDDLRYLSEIDRVEWFDLLASDLADVERLVSSFPQAGKLIASRDGKELRKKTLRKTPFVVFYDFEPARRTGPVRLVWLVHVRAKGPAPSKW